MGAAPLLTFDHRLPSPFWLWAGIFAGPIAWAADLSVSYAAVKWVCATQHYTLLYLTTGLAVGVATSAAMLSWAFVQQTEDAGPTAGGTPAQRARFMAQCGVASSVFFAIATLALGIPRWVLDACH